MNTCQLTNTSFVERSDIKLRTEAGTEVVIQAITHEVVNLRVSHIDISVGTTERRK